MMDWAAEARFLDRAFGGLLRGEKIGKFLAVGSVIVRCASCLGRQVRLGEKKFASTQKRSFAVGIAKGGIGKSSVAIGYFAVGAPEHNSGQNRKLALFANRLICYFSSVIIGPMLRFASVSFIPLAWLPECRDGNRQFSNP
ncbi:MAG: hypothetical protein AB8B91_11170 [Rubripirellula sp.]